MNTFRVAYPSSRSLPGQVFRPVVDPRTYLRAVHLITMFPLGIAYFVSLVTLFAIGGPLIWTFPGVLILLVAIFGSRLVGDLEAIMVSKVSDIEIRRPPWRTEGAEGWRSRLWIRLIDPTTWTGIVYLFVQFPLGIGAFVSLVVTYAVAGAFVASPVVIHFTNDPLEGDFAGWSFVMDTPAEALWLVPVGLVMLLLSAHIVTVASVLHATWAKFMLGSRAQTVPSSSQPPEDPDPSRSSAGAESDESPRSFPLPVDRSAVRPFDQPAHEGGTSLSKVPPQSDRSGLAPPLPFPGSSLPDSLTRREREVLLLLARGRTNAEIAEEFVISQGTVKTHVKRILAKLNLHDRTQVVVFAYESGLINPGPTQATSSSVINS